MCNARRSGSDPDFIAQPGAADALAGHAAHHRVDDAVVARLLGRHEVVALRVGVHLVHRLLHVAGHDLLHTALERQDLAGADLDVGRLALEARRVPLVDHHLRVRQGQPLALGATGQEHRPHRHRHAETDRLYVAAHVLHGVVDREPSVDVAARRVDVERDVLVGIVGREVDDLGDDQVRDLGRDRRAQEDNAVVQEPRVDVERALAAAGLLDDHRNQR
jgi:hypothetical protein